MKAKGQYISVGNILSGQSAVARKIATKNHSKAVDGLSSAVTSQSESNLTAAFGTRRRNPFADSSDEDDFVDIADLPPVVPAKASRPPPALPVKQKINKSKADLAKIDEMLKKSATNLAATSGQEGQNNITDEDYAEVPETKQGVGSSEYCPEDYDEPVPMPTL